MTELAKELERLKTLNGNCTACSDRSCDACGERCLKIVELLEVPQPSNEQIMKYFKSVLED